MEDVKHEGTIDSSVDHYEITALDRPTRKVLVNFAYKGHGLHHSVFVDDIEDSAGILAAIEAHYKQYKGDVERAQAQQVALPDDVLALVGQKTSKG